MSRVRQPIRRPLFVTSAVAGVIGALLATNAAEAQSAAPSPLPGVARTDLLRQDLSIAGREVLQVRVDIGPGVVAPRHSHPGEEIAYVLSGSLEYQVEGRPPVTLNAGEVLFIPAGTVHAARNVGSGTASELATYIVEKGRPLVTLTP